MFLTPFAQRKQAYCVKKVGQKWAKNGPKMGQEQPKSPNKPAPENHVRLTGRTSVSVG